MTSRQRVLAALRHEEPDRTPFFEKLVKSPIADLILGRPHAEVNFNYRMQRLADGDWRGLMEQTARDIIDVAQLLGFDLVRLGPNPLPGPRPQRLGPDRWQVGSVIQELLCSGWVRTTAVAPQPPLPPEQQEEALRRSVRTPYEPRALTDDEWIVFRTARRLIDERGLDLAIFSQVYGMPVATLGPILFEWFHTDRESLHLYYQRCSQAALDRARQLRAEGADLIGLGGDLASDHGPLIAPRDYAEFLAPRLREQSDALHALGAFTSNASDGDLWPLLDHFLLDADVDAFEEIDYAAGMDLARLKARYGWRICFIGNIDIRHILTAGTEQEARAATIECLKQGAGHGGHILMSSNCIHESVQPKSFFAYVNAYRNYFGLDPVDF